jgi:hypothetical protein
MTEIVSLEKKDKHYIVVLRYTPNWLMRLFGKKGFEKTYVSIYNGCCYDIDAGYDLDFTDIDGKEMSTGDRLFVNRYILNFVYEKIQKETMKKREEVFRSVMGI